MLVSFAPVAAILYLTHCQSALTFRPACNGRGHKLTGSDASLTYNILLRSHTDLYYNNLGLTATSFAILFEDNGESNNKQ